MRNASVTRTTKETEIAIEVDSTAAAMHRSRPASASSTTCSICWLAIP